MGYTTTLHYHKSMVLEAIYDLGRADISSEATQLTETILVEHQEHVKRIQKEIADL